MDIFTHKSINYLVITDYFSDYFEFEKLNDMSAREVIEICKRCFARLGIPEIVHSDNGPQFSAREFAVFSNEWDFLHTTSSPYHSQSNGKAESSVKLAKRLLKRAADPQLALLEYRNTITAGMTTSPIQRLLHRSTRSIIPQLDCGRTDDKQSRTEKERKLRRTQYHYNKHARDLPPIKEGTPVLVRDFTSHKRKWKDAQVYKQLTDRSYSVISQGEVLRRNRKHMIPQDTTTEVDNPITTDDPLNQDDTTVRSVPVDHQEMKTDSSVRSADDNVTQTVTTRSGRLIKPPAWHKDYAL